MDYNNNNFDTSADHLDNNYSHCNKVSVACFGPEHIVYFRLVILPKAILPKAIFKQAIFMQAPCMQITSIMELFCLKNFGNEVEFITRFFNAFGQVKLPYA